MSERREIYLNGKNKPGAVFWSVLMERSIQGEAVAALLDVAGAAAQAGAKRITLGYMRTDMARNLIVEAFLQNSSGPNDVLVMLDADHTHPAETVVRLASYPAEIGVIGALAYRRGGHHDPCFFLADEKGELHAPMIWQYGEVYECAAVGTGAIAIKRWVFDKLTTAGYPWPYFRYEYPKAGAVPSEDIVFARACMAAGIPHHCDTGLMTPHILTSYADGQQWRQFVEEQTSKQQEAI